MKDHDEVREAIAEVVDEIPGLRMMGEAELVHVLDQMKAHHDAEQDEPDVLPRAPIDFIPENVWDDEDDPLHLLTLDEYGRVPDGALLVSINGKAKVKGRDDIDMDTRFGCIAWGFRESQLDAALGDNDEY